MSLETDVQVLTQATTDLLSAVNVKKATLDQTVDDAAAQVALATTQATNAAASAATATTKASEAAGSAASALAIYGNTAAQQAAVTAAQNAASVAAGHAASASSVVQQDLSGVNAAALHRSPNAVTAMFVYDTSKDSDGGAWTEKCQHTSWYNEAINGKWLGAQASEAAARAVSGATTGDYFQLTTDGKFYKLNATSGTTEVFRGNKRDFPRLAAIVAEASNVTIYDLTEPNRPMWMRFMRDVNAALKSDTSVSSVAAVNGYLLAVGAASAGRLTTFSFSEDKMTLAVGGSVRYGLAQSGIASRNLQNNIVASESGALLSTDYNPSHCAVSVFPDAPFNLVGLKKPTIAIATSGGINIIKDNDSVIRMTASVWTNGRVAIGQNFILGHRSLDGGTPDYFFGNVRNLASGNLLQGGTIPDYGGASQGAASNVFTSPNGLEQVRSTVAGQLNKIRHFPSSYAKGVSSRITNTFNTGHQVGDIRRTYLSVTGSGSVGGELIVNGVDFIDSDANGIPDGWTVGTAVSVVNGDLVLAPTNYSNASIQSASFPTIPGVQYVLEIQVTQKTAGTLYYNFWPADSTWVNTDGRDPQAAVGVNTKVFTASSTSSKFVLNDYANGGTATIAYVSVKALEPDCSYKGKTANITGTLTRTPVATGAQLVAYSGFSAGNYLREPYSADLDFGTGEWTASAWVNVPVSLSLASFPVSTTNLFVAPLNVNGAWVNNGDGSFTNNTTVGDQIQKTGLSSNITGMSVTFTVAQGSVNVIDGAGGYATGNLGVGTHTIRLGQSGSSIGIRAASVPVTVANITANELDPLAISHRAASSGASLFLGVKPQGRLTATAYDGTTTRTVITAAAYNTATWLKVRANYTTDGSLALLVNGQEVAVTRGAPLLTLNNSNAVLTIGNSYAADAPFPGSIALLKLSATVPTAEQSVWMYEQEKQLFRDGAQCCLPDSGSIVDLTYDDAADKWIAVSATNESEWSGLVRTSVTAVPAGSYTKAAAASGVQLLARSTSSPGVDITIPAYGLREELVKRAESAARLARSLVLFDYVGGFTANTTNGSTSITSVAGLTYPVSYVGAKVTGSGIPTDTVITAVSGTAIYLSKATTATATGVQISFTDFILPVGYEAKAVLSAGSVKTEGSTKDYTRLFDGFRETIRFGTAPGYQAAVQIQATRSAA